MQTAPVSLLRGLLFFVFLVVSQLGVASSAVFEGGSLAEPLSIELDFSGADYALVTASQRSADYQLSLKEGESAEVLKTVDTNAGKFMDEVFFLNQNECVKCVIVLTGKGRIDQNSPYKVTVTYFSDGLKNTGVEKELAAILSSISLVGELSFKASKEASNDALITRKKAAELTQSIISRQVLPENRKWVIRAKTMLLQLMADMRSPSGAKELAHSIIDEGSDGAVDDAIFAYYDLASLSSDALQREKFYTEGMTLAKSADRDLPFAHAANRLSIQLVHQAKFDKALELLKQAQGIYRSNENYGALLSPLSNLSWAHLRAGDVPKAIASAAEQKLFAEQYLLKVEAIWALYNMALAYGEIGERYKVDDLFEEALVAYSKLDDVLKEDARLLYGGLLRERAESLSRLGDYESAKDFARQAKAFFIARNTPQEIANAKYLEGTIAIAEGNYPLARTLIQESIEFEEKNNRYRNAGLRYLRLAELEMHDGKLVAAAEYQNRALKFLIETQDELNKAVAFSQSVELLTLMGQLDKAQRIAERSLDYVNRFGPEHDRVKFTYRVAKVEFELGNYRVALEKLAEARTVIDETLPKIRRRDLRQHYFALQKKIFELNIGALIKADNAIEALRLVESYKARTLREVIVQVGDSMALELASARDDIHERILGNARALYSSGNSDSEEVLARTRRLISTLEKIEAEFESTQRDNLAAVKFAMQTPEVSHSGELLAYYFIGNNHSWLWLVSSQGYEVFSLPPEAEILELVSSVKARFSTHPANRFGISAWEQKKQLRVLSEMLLSPMKERLMAGNVENLTVVSDGPLDGFPFGPLLLGEADEPLISHVAISHIPSSSSQKALEERSKRKSKDMSDAHILVVADPVGDASKGAEIDRLPFSAVEAKLIGEMFVGRSKLMLAESAQKKDILPQVSSKHSILHFATHGLLNNAEPSLSGLMFSKVSDEPHYWLAPEISRANLKADLVVLSACESSIGKGVAGEGMFSLSRAFIEGGASNVIGSLWQVEDSATADLMTNFYSALLDDSLVVSVALQRAQIATYSNKNNDWRDPYFWAGFQLQGGWNILSYGRK